jgi:oxygen-independent coproporphyrinogen-3 oxidase
MSTLEDTEALPRWIWPRAAYVHVPFCAHHCGYCDFAVAAGRDHLQEAYLDALEAEIGTVGTPQPVETLFLGGGTPTHLTAGLLERLLRVLARWLPLSRGGEFTVEANPESFTADKAAILAGHGVTRVSLGAQSFHPDLLRVLERAHDPAAIGPAADRARLHGLQVSLDLIFGVPGQSLAQWADDLRRGLVLGPVHVSTYGLTYEKGTPLWKQRRARLLRPLDEEAELAMYDLAIDTLEAAGFDHYEISNFARPGRRSRHNQVYWANEAYFGFGLGAARYVRGVRAVNTRDLAAYIRRAKGGESVTQSSERLDDDERARETMAVQLRRADGIDRPAFLLQTGRDLDAVAGGRLAWLVEQGLLRDDGRSVALTRRGRHVADAVIERLL